ncbi:hypothetical protein [Gordonia sp. 852002-51296_SCH5728562-b]|uniref:hypothetical protein n=1 Tax=Gordonia sp. 852002-51296_SCH5728562-b TaxID=1834101 RepID=UPI001E38C1AB|nr:hypothetical protein [Gordonia sp. 852002-51296_SCH5728562-b]
MGNTRPGAESDRTRWGSGLRQLTAAEWHVIRGRDPDLDAVEISEFSGPLLAGWLVIATVGVLPLVGTRLSDSADSLFGPLIGSFALAAVCTTTVAWLLSALISGLVVLIVYDVGPKVASAATEGAMRGSFARIEGAASSVTLVALISGLISLAIGLPSMASSDDESSVIEELLSAQVACLLLVLMLGFTVESIRTAAEILGSQVRVIGWLGSLAIVLTSFYIASSAGPFAPVKLTRNILEAWLPAEVDGVSRAQVISDVMPNNSYLWSMLIIAPFVIIMWFATAWRLGAIRNLRAAVRVAAGQGETGQGYGDSGQGDRGQGDRGPGEIALAAGARDADGQEAGGRDADGQEADARDTDGQAAGGKQLDVQEVEDTDQRE